MSPPPRLRGEVRLIGKPETLDARRPPKPAAQIGATRRLWREQRDGRHPKIVSFYLIQAAASGTLRTPSPLRLPLREPTPPPMAAPRSARQSANPPLTARPVQPRRDSPAG